MDDVARTFYLEKTVELAAAEGDGDVTVGTNVSFASIFKKHVFAINTYHKNNNLTIVRRSSYRFRAQ